MTDPAPSPAHFFETVNSFHRSAAVKAAIELSVFSTIGNEAKNTQAIAKDCNASERGIRILCDFLVVHGLLTKQECFYRLTPDSAVFLDRNSPAYCGGAIEFMLSPTMINGFNELTEAVRIGGQAASKEGVVEPDHPVWVRFARAMAPLMMMPAHLMAELVDQHPGQEIKVLDIAAGHGLFGIAFAQRNPKAKITALDWTPVLQVAQENAVNAGVRDRFKTLEGSAFDVNFGNGYDLVLLTNFLHHFDRSTCEQLLKKVRAALADGGRAITLEFVPNEDRVSPPIPAAFSLIMLSNTPAGDAYTFGELERMFKEAGFSQSALHPLPPTFQSVVISRK